MDEQPPKRSRWLSGIRSAASAAIGATLGVLAGGVIGYLQVARPEVQADGGFQQMLGSGLLVFTGVLRVVAILFCGGMGGILGAVLGAFVSRFLPTPRDREP